MKIISSLTILFFAQVLLASNALENKSLHVGTSDIPGKFSSCTAEEAIKIILGQSYKLVKLLHSGVDTNNNKPWGQAELTFMAEDLTSTKKKFYRLRLTSLGDSGWQLIMLSTGEIAPFSQAVSTNATLFDGSGNDLGIYDLENCRDVD